MFRTRAIHRRGDATKIVLTSIALVAVAVVILWPVWQGVRDISQLRQAAEMVVEAGTTARLNAMSYGRIHLLRFEPEQGHFVVQQSPEVDAGIELGFVSAENAALPPVDWSVEGEQLPDGNFFVAVQLEKDERNAILGDLLASPDVPLAKADSPIMFFPDGVTSTATLILRNARGDRFIEVKFDGPSGQVTAGEPFTTQRIGGGP